MFPYNHQSVRTVQFLDCSILLLNRCFLLYQAFLHHNHNRLFYHLFFQNHHIQSVTLFLLMIFQPLHFDCFHSNKFVFHLHFLLRFVLLHRYEHHHYQKAQVYFQLSYLKDNLCIHIFHWILDP